MINFQEANNVGDAQISTCAVCKKCKGFDNYYYNPELCKIREEF